LEIRSDQLLIVVAPPATTPEIGSAHHVIALWIGPYRLTVDLPTLPGFHPLRSLARPAGTFLPLGRARVTASDPSFEELDHPHVWFNGYLVTRVEAEFDLQTFFPGAEMVIVEPEPEAGPSPRPGRAHPGRAGNGSTRSEAGRPELSLRNAATGRAPEAPVGAIGELPT